jgi:hypothetical protein
MESIPAIVDKECEISCNQQRRLSRLYRLVAHDLTIAPGMLLALVRDEQSKEAILRFSQDWQKMKTL